MKPLVRVLLVTDDFTVGGAPRGGYLRWMDQNASAAITEASREFHLGEFTRCLVETNWVGFNVELTRAHRAVAGTNGMNEAQLKADRGADVIGFRFDQPFTVNGASRTLADYDMALFFSIEVGDPNAGLAAEAEAIATFMENGGGFFATGDHANLGATLCGLVPRVRSMRRWWSGAGPNGEPAAPSPIGPSRHDTTRAGSDNVTHFEDQSDDVPQEIEPKMYQAGLVVVGGYPATKSLPHPLLCSPEGRITYLPDHMHEGWCEVPGNLASRQFTLAGNSVREYPDYTPANPPAGYVPEPLAPEVVATATVLPGVTSPALDPEHFGGIDPATGKTFGVIGAWDGHRVGKGRVVVDATWHHFFDINLSGDRYLEDNGLPVSHQQKLAGFYVLDDTDTRVPNHAYRMIQWYFRNIVYWLIPARRRRSLWWWELAAVLKRPRLAEELGALKSRDALRELRFDLLYYFGQLAEDYFAQARGHCARYRVHEYQFKPKIPWWEWIQDFGDVWDPIVKGRRREETQRAQWLGAVGAGPRTDVAATLTLGAALVTVAMQREALDRQASEAETAKALDAAFMPVLERAIGEYREVLAAGARLESRLAKVAEAGLKER